MSQHDLNIANQGFPAFRSDLNDALVALGTNASGATEPSTTFAHQFWMDTAADPSILKVRNADNDAWITLGTFNQTTDTFTPAGVTSDKIEEGNSKVEVVDTGTGYIVFEVDGAEVARFNPDQLVTKAGTASTPAISPTGDLNTGIFFPAADTIAFAEGGAEAMRIDSSGNLLVGTTSNALNYRVYVYGRNADNPAAMAAQPFVNGAYALGIQNASGTNVGGVIANASTTSYNTSSDYRLKHDIQPMTGALAKVAQLKPCTYTWKADGSTGEGFIAHELQEVVPECVSGEKDAVETYTDEEGNEQTRIKPQGIDTSFLVATLTAAIQELSAKNDALEARIATLEQA